MDVRGLSKAVDEVFPESDKQRCTKHKTENVLDKALEQDRASVKESVWKVFYASTYEHAKEAVEMFKEKVEHEISFSGRVSHRRYRELPDLLQISLSALANDTDDQCSGTEFQGGEAKSKRDRTVSA